MIDQVYSYREMCDLENVQTLQRGMNFRLNPSYSLILMSRRGNAPYRDSVSSDGITIRYEGHDVPKTFDIIDPKVLDQPRYTRTGTLTQNGKFIESIEEYKKTQKSPEIVKVYEKVLDGVWSLKGYFELIDYANEFDGKRNVFVFVLRLTKDQGPGSGDDIDLSHTRLIPPSVKKDVWARDAGMCVICGSKKNLHFDHDLPFSKGGTSLSAENIKILCAKCNLSKSDKIE